LDYAGPVEGKMLLVLIDAHSKWVEVFNTPSATSGAVITELRTTFARFGLPETIVTDNGTCFVSAEFEQFLQQNGIRHLTSAPYHPSSNGLAERTVQIVKKGLKKVTNGSISDRLARVLLTYRLTPQGTTGISPAELLLGRRPRTRLDLLKPHTADRVESKQAQQKLKHDNTSKFRVFQIGDSVWIKNHGTGHPWLAGVIESKSGPVNFSVRLEDGRFRRCHLEHLRKRQSPDHTAGMSHQSNLGLPELATPTGSGSQALDMPPDTVPPAAVPDVPMTLEAPTHPDPAEPAAPPSSEPEPKSPLAQEIGEKTPRKVYPSRVHKKPMRFEPVWNCMRTV